MNGLLPREKLGEDVEPFSPSAIETRTRRLFTNLPSSRQQDTEQDGFRNALRKETPKSTHSSDGAPYTLKNGAEIQIGPIFGPVLCVIAYDDEEDAIRIANETSFGLHAFVSGTDVQRARRVASQIEAGRVAINGMLDDHQAPFGRF
jgi:hypothetical protein